MDNIMYNILYKIKQYWIISSNIISNILYNNEQY